MLHSTSIASLPDVAGNPKHIDNPFLWIASNFFMFSVGVICQTGQPYSMFDLIRLLYILSSFVLEMFAKHFSYYMDGIVGFSLYMHDVVVKFDLLI